MNRERWRLAFHGWVYCNLLGSKLLYIIILSVCSSKALSLASVWPCCTLFKLCSYPSKGLIPQTHRCTKTLFMLGTVVFFSSNQVNYYLIAHKTISLVDAVENCLGGHPLWQAHEQVFHARLKSSAINSHFEVWKSIISYCFGQLWPLRSTELFSTRKNRTSFFWEILY